MRRFATAFLVLSAGFALQARAAEPAPAAAAPPLFPNGTSMTAPIATAVSPVPGSRDFAFLTGKWNVANRQLKAIFAGSKEWDEYPATSVAVPMLDGSAVVDELRAPSRGIHGFSIHLFEPKTQEWNVLWVSASNGKLQVPMRGRLVNGVFEFQGDDTHEGKPIRARYRWTNISQNAATWEQAYSPDGGKSWEVNWVMQFTRDLT